MRARTLVVVLLLAVLPPAGASALERGARAPDFRLRDLAGRSASLSALRGRVVLLDFWASWCAPCRKSFPFYNRLHREYGRQGLCVIGISVDNERARIRSFLRQTPAHFRILHDRGKGVVDQYEPGTMPTAYLIDRNGLVRYVHAGFVASDEAVIERKVRELLGR